MFSFTRALCAAALLWPTPGYSQQFFPFSIDQDHLSGAADWSSLNHPLAPGDRLRVCGEQFCRSSDGSGVRLFGVNFAFGANFPKETDAPAIAKRLRRLGVNLVRLHHMDSSPDRNPESSRSLLTTGPYPTLNPISVARLRAFLDALKAEGIYVDLNLHVGYTFRPSVDNVPSLAQFPTQSKPLHIFYPRMVDLQCEYTRQVIDALRLRDDPVLGVVEINNESSLIYAWQNNLLDPYLTGDYQQALQTQWNAYLKKRYPNTQALRTAWGESQSDGAEMLNETWTMENHSGGPASIRLAHGVAVVRLRSGGSVIAKQVGFSIDTAQGYIAELEIRADLPDGVSRKISWDLKRDVSPWDQIGSKTIAVTNQWKKFRIAIQQPRAAFDKNGRFGLELQDVDASARVYMRNASLRVAGRRGLNPDESLEAGNVALVSDDVATRPRLNDYMLFLASVDRSYLDRMQAAVRESAGPVVPVAGTQVRYGGLMNLDTHDGLSFQDNHFYIDHYQFPHVQWDAHDWRQKNQSGIATGLTELAGIAVERQSGRPYTVSEFNQPWPNTQANEIDVITAALGAFQGWDAIMHFAYSHAADWATAEPNGFNLNGDWSKDVLLGQAAWLFRAGIQPGRTAIDEPVPQDLRLRALREKQNWNTAKFLAEATGVDLSEVFVHRVRMVKDGTPATPPAKPAAPYQSDTGELTYDPEARLYLIHAPQAAGVFGYAGNRPVTSGPLEVQLAERARGYVTLLLTSLDNRPLAASHHLLLSTPGYTLRSAIGANPPRPQKLVNYPGTTNLWTLEPDPKSDKPSADINRGPAPIWMERVESTIRFSTEAKNLRIYPLNGSGARLAPLTDKDVQPVKGGFRIHLQAEGQSLSPWFEIEVP